MSWWKGDNPTDYNGEDCGVVPTSASSIDELLNDIACTRTDADYFLCDAPTYLVNVGGDPGYALAECEGDCDGDLECAGDLVCFHNLIGETNVPPGCQGPASEGYDYCYDASSSGKAAPSIVDGIWENMERLNEHKETSGNGDMQWKNSVKVDQVTKHVADGSEVIMLSMKDIVIIFLVLVNVITLIVLAVGCFRKCASGVSYKPVEMESEMDDLL